jgi:hypothetical protein
VLDRAVVAARQQQQPLRLRRRRMELLADRPRHLLVAARVEQQQRRLRPEAGHRGVEVERLEPRHERVGVGARVLEAARAQAAPQQVLRSRADADDRDRVAGAGGGVDRRPAAHARAAQRDRRRVLAQQLEHRQRVVERARAERALGAAMAAGVEGERRHPLGAAEAGEVEVALLRGAGAVEDQDAAAGRVRGQEERVGEPVVRAEVLGWGRSGVLHTSPTIWPRRPTPPPSRTSIHAARG